MGLERSTVERRQLIHGDVDVLGNPVGFDVGILAGAPAINWTKFITTELYPQVVMQRELGGVPLTLRQLSLVSRAALASCDVVGGKHLGYLLQPESCAYDPTKDAAVLCAADGGNDAADCLSKTQAGVVNKIWYGLTHDGQAPDPTRDNGFNVHPSRDQRWFGLARGTNLGFLAGQKPFAVAADLVAMELGDPRLSLPSFINASGNGRDGWRQLSTADLNLAFDRGLELQNAFSRINTDNPDLSAFRDSGAKLLMYHGLADILIPPQGSINYYERVAAPDGRLRSYQAVLSFLPRSRHEPCLRQRNG